MEMGKIADALSGAKEHALNDVQKAMHSEYVKAFHDGSMAAHLDSQRKWIKDIQPAGMLTTLEIPALTFMRLHMGLLVAY